MQIFKKKMIDLNIEITILMNFICVLTVEEFRTGLTNETLKNVIQQI